MRLEKGGPDTLKNWDQIHVGTRVGQRLLIRGMGWDSRGYVRHTFYERLLGYEGRDLGLISKALGLGPGDVPARRDVRYHVRI